MAGIGIPWRVNVLSDADPPIKFLLTAIGPSMNRGLLKQRYIYDRN